MSTLTKVTPGAALRLSPAIPGEGADKNVCGSRAVTVWEHTIYHPASLAEKQTTGGLGFCEHLGSVSFLSAPCSKQDRTQTEPCADFSVLTGSSHMRDNPFEVFGGSWPQKAGVAWEGVLMPELKSAWRSLNLTPISHPTCL